MKNALVGAAIVASICSIVPAQAAITALGAGVLTNGSTIVDFDAPLQPNGTPLGNVTLGGIDFSGSGQLFTGTVGGISAAPFGDATQYLSILGGGSQTLTFSYLHSQFGLYWGSVDSYNTIAFYNGSTLVNSYTGTQVVVAAGLNSAFLGNQTSDQSNRYFQFSFGSGEAFDRVVLSSTRNSFEFDNISAGVPEPSTWAMMLIGFAGLGYAARRRQQTRYA